VFLDSIINFMWYPLNFVLFWYYFNVYSYVYLRKCVCNICNSLLLLLVFVWLLFCCADVFFSHWDCTWWLKISPFWGNWRNIVCGIRAKLSVITVNVDLVKFYLIIYLVNLSLYSWSEGDRYVINQILLCVQSVEYKGDIDSQGTIVRQNRVRHTRKINTGKPLLFILLVAYAG
jgi:hypothetical protein